MLKVIVAGAGIAGLAAAWELRQAGVDVTVIESELRPGGVIVTERRDGFVVEGGPDGFLAAEPEIPALAAELGIADRIVAQQVRGTSRWIGKRFEPLEEGRAAELLGIETRASDLTAGFRTFIGGMEELIAALAERLPLDLGQGITEGIAPRDQGWRVWLREDSTHDADGLVLAVPTYVASRWLSQIGVQGSGKLAEVVYAPSLTVSLAYKADQIARLLEGSGFVGTPPLRACTYASSKFAGRAPDGHVLLRAFLAPNREDSATLAHNQLAAILKIRGEPLWSRVFHWPRGLPRYPERYGLHLAALRERLARLAVAIAGAGYDGAGVSACVRSGREAARMLLGRLGS